MLRPGVEERQQLRIRALRRRRRRRGRRGSQPGEAEEVQAPVVVEAEDM
jgi:hypothetical protein